MIPYIKLAKIFGFVVIGGVLGYYLLATFLTYFGVDSTTASNIGVNAGVIIGGFLAVYF